MSSNIWEQINVEFGGSSLRIEQTTVQERECCDKCGSEVAIGDEGYPVCSNMGCGHMFTDYLNYDAEWRFYSGEGSNPTRCGMPVNPLLKESSYGCKILSSSSSSYEMRKIRRYTDWMSMPYKEKSQYDEFQHIITMGSNAGIPKYIIDDALKYHKKISEQEETYRGLNRDGIIAASVYISGRLNNYPRTAKEIAAIFHLDVTSATRGCKNAMMIINRMEKNMGADDKTALCETKPTSFIERFTSKLGYTKELTKVCMFVAMCIEKKGLIKENTPHSIAAGVVYFVGVSCNQNVSKRAVRNVSEISEVTINKCYKKLETMREQLIPAVILRKYANEN